MTQEVDFEQLRSDDAGDRARAGADSVGDLRRLSAVPVDLSVEIGRARMSVGETLELREGSVVTLDRMAGEPVDLLVNGMPIARGEVVVIDEQFGLRLTQVLASASTGEPGEGSTYAEPVASAEPVVQPVVQEDAAAYAEPVADPSAAPAAEAVAG